MDGATAEPVSSRYRNYVLGMLCLVYTLNFLDRQLLSIVAEPVKRDLGLTDTQLGLLTGLAFAVVYTFLGIPVAILADRSNRVRIVSAACAIWSGFTVMSGMATSFATLAFARAGVGLGEAGGSPPSYSIVSDYFPPSQRGMAVAILSCAIPFGVILGSLMGGAIAAVYGWQAAFIALGVFGVLVAPVLLFTVKEPAREQTPQTASGESPKLLSGITAFFSNPILLLVTAAAAFTACIAYALLAWGPAMLLREKGAEMSDLALYYSFAVGGALLVGTFGTGFLIDRLGRKSLAAYALVPGIATLAAAPFLAGFALVPGWPAALGMLMVVSLLTTSYFTASMTIVQNAVAPNQRATTSAMLLFFINLLGLGVGPLIVGVVSDLYADSGQGLVYGVLALVPLCVLAFVVQLPLARLLARRGTWSNA